MGIITKTAHFLFSIYGLLIFTIWMLLLLPFFIIAFFLPVPANGNMVFFLCRIWATLFFICTFIRFKKINSISLPEDKPCVFVTNHISYIDIPAMVLSTAPKKIRILGKSEMGSIPIFGFIYKMGTVSVNRKSAEERQKSVQQLKFFLSKNVSVLICPEGTFNMTNKPLKNFYDGAFIIASEMNIPIVPIIFPDTYNRLNYHSVFSLDPGKCRAFILPAINTAGMDAIALKEKVYAAMEKKLIELQAGWISKT